MKCIAVIPVRGWEWGKSSCTSFLGKRLIDWTIDEAMKSKKISDIIITTPDEKILTHVNKNIKMCLHIKGT